MFPTFKEVNVNVANGWLNGHIIMCIYVRLPFITKALEHLHEHKGLDTFIGYLLFVVGR